jgi:hypothetical protein
MLVIKLVHHVQEISAGVELDVFTSGETNLEAEGTIFHYLPSGIVRRTLGPSPSGAKETTSSSYCSGRQRAASESASCWKLTNMDRRAASAGAAV